ncbi:MAG: AAA domain-containing protein [Clostridiales bacterium]|nr:AAA domain-containing protein [Clostridiales bacterium]
MLKTKMNNVISEVCDSLAERDELVHTIALALLTRKNLFVLGDPGQAKSQAIDKFRSHITDAKQFDVLMSKGIDQEQLFGRLDLASIIPGHISNSRLNSDPKYCEMRKELRMLMDTAESDSDFIHLVELEGKMSRYQRGLAMYHQGSPEILTDGKIPDSHICFLDELFKANDGVLNSLLKALNERKYTNEGVTTDIPVVSFFSASNEIPNFNNPEEKCLRALYDRFDFKVCTRNVADRGNRMKILKAKQNGTDCYIGTTFTLDELWHMQDEVEAVIVPDSIYEIADNILCELRRKNISVSDRTYFNFAPVVKAEAWLDGRDTVIPADLMALVNYLWNKPEEYASVQETIEKLITNPLGDKLDALLAKAHDLRKAFEAELDKNKALLSFRNNIVAVYDGAEALKAEISENDPALSSIEGMLDSVETINREVHGQTRFTYLPLAELKAMKTNS